MDRGRHRHRGTLISQKKCFRRSISTIWNENSYIIDVEQQIINSICNNDLQGLVSDGSGFGFDVLRYDVSCEEEKGARGGNGLMLVIF